MPLSRSNPRRGKYAKLGVAIVIFAFYYQLFVVARTWLEKGKVLPLIGIWWVPLLLAGLAVFLLWRTGEVFRRCRILRDRPVRLHPRLQPLREAPRPLQGLAEAQG